LEAGFVNVSEVVPTADVKLAGVVVLVVVVDDVEGGFRCEE
jgi:hypothetical protein